MKRKGSERIPRGDRPIREKAYALIQQKIARGELMPGSAISEVLLAQELGSSRTPVREALGQLVAEGLLEQTPNRGTVVVQLRRQDIVDLYELREALELYAVGKAARQNNSPRDIKRLTEFANEILTLASELKHAHTTQLDGKQMQRFIACDLGFHTQLLRMAANARILKIVNETRLLIQIFSISRRGHSAAMLDKIYKYHSSIIDAVSKGDPTQAVQIMSQHIQESQQERLEEFDQWEHEAAMRERMPVFFDFQNAERGAGK